MAVAVLLGGCVACAEQKVARYSEYGAVGDGVADDFDAIIKTHDAANAAGLGVRADAGATYYIGAANKTAKILTDTDWGNAKFIIDDSKVSVENRNSAVFRITSKLPSAKITTIASLKKNQQKIDVSLPHDALVEVVDNSTMRYIRYGLNQNNGAAQTDVFVVDKNGRVDMRAPIIWDFDKISAMTAFPIDPETLTVKGGHFTTIANQAESRYTYYARNISVNRSNVMIDGIVHVITGELDHGAPYGGFISVGTCNNVTVQNATLSGHKIYSTIGSADKSVTMGTYDISVNKAVNVTFKNCKQANDINDTKLWGILGSNHSKNMTYDTVSFSRFDAHMGVANATIKNSVLGHQGINLIGSGVFLIENTKVHAAAFINLRPDYGSTWDGDIVIRNCEFFPRYWTAVLLNGNNSGQHNFGYTCHMPRKITIDGLVVHDSNPPKDYSGPKLFGAFNNAYTSEAYVEKYPYVITEEVIISNLTAESGKPYVISTSPFMFRNVRITEGKKF